MTTPLFLLRCVQLGLSIKDTLFNTSELEAERLRLQEEMNVVAELIEQCVAENARIVTWNLAVKMLGAVKTSVYIYMVPVITVVTSVLILKEPVTWVSIMGTVLAVAGLFLSEYNGKGSGNGE